MVAYRCRWCCMRLLATDIMYIRYTLINVHAPVNPSPLLSCLPDLDPYMLADLPLTSDLDPCQALSRSEAMRAYTPSSLMPFPRRWLTWRTPFRLRAPAPHLGLLLSSDRYTPRCPGSARPLASLCLECGTGVLIRCSASLSVCVSVFMFCAVLLL